MKKILFLAILFTSCSSKNYSVKLISNNSIIETEDETDRSFKIGDTVCVYSWNSNHWKLDNSGVMYDSVKQEQGYSVEYRVGTIVK